MNGKQYRELLGRLNLNKALKSQLHAGFRPDFHHDLVRVDSHYLPNASDTRPMAPPLTEDYSMLGKSSHAKRQTGPTEYWAKMTPEQRRIQKAKRSQNAKDWHTKAKAKGTICVKDFVAKYTIKNRKPKQKP